MKGKIITALTIVFFILVIATGVKVYAKADKTVRVSTEKQLKAAMKNADVGTIIFKTNAYINVTIKPVKGSEEKSLIIDAQDVSFNNKAVFAKIDIKRAKKYVENVSGNILIIPKSIYIDDGIIVSTKKKVKKLTVYDDSCYFNYDYTLRKGAKISELEYIYMGEDYPVKYSYDKDKKILSMEYTDSKGCECSYTIKFDKSGRMIRNKCVSNWVECTFDYTYTYDKNGNLIRYSGSDNDSGDFMIENTFKDNRIIKSTYESSFDEAGLTEYSYDSNGNLIREEYKGYTSIDGQHFDSYKIFEYKYDKKGRVIYERKDPLGSGLFSEATSKYNSKGFMVERYSNILGSEYLIKYQYNKAGDMIKMIFEYDGKTDIYEYEYDEFGEHITTKK